MELFILGLVLITSIATVDVRSKKKDNEATEDELE